MASQASKYSPIMVRAEHEQLLQRHRQLIKKTYNIDNDDLKILEVEVKITEQKGGYYRMTIRDGNRKTYRVKLEAPHVDLNKPYEKAPERAAEQA